MSIEPLGYSVFLSHSAKDKAVVRPLADRLRACRAVAARRRRTDGLKVWPVAPKRPRVGGFDEWALKPGDSIPAKIGRLSLGSSGAIEEGLEHSRVLACHAEAPERRRMLCLSANAFGSDWAQLACPAVASERRRKAGTCGRRNLRFRGPLNPSSAKRLRAGRQERRFLPLRLDDAHDHNDCRRRKKARCSPAELGP